MKVLLYFDSRLPDGGARNFHGAEMPRVGLWCNRDHRLIRRRRRRTLERIFHQLFRTERGLLSVSLTDYLVIVTKSRTKTPCTKPFYVHVRVSIEAVCHNNWTVYSYFSIKEATDKVQKGFTSLHLCQMAYIYAETRPHYYSQRSP